MAHLSQKNQEAIPMNPKLEYAQLVEQGGEEHQEARWPIKTSSVACIYSYFTRCGKTSVLSIV